MGVGYLLGQLLSIESTFPVRCQKIMPVRLFVSPVYKFLLHPPVGLL